MNHDNPEPKYIHLVALYTRYEGHGFPEAAFMDEDKADALANRLNEGFQSSNGYYEVLSVEIKDGL